MKANTTLLTALQMEGIRDARVMQAFGRVARGGFVPRGVEPEADLDRPVPIGRGQVTTQPSLIARMVEALELRGGERVLEIGTGFGYQTAILAELAREVVSIERFADIAGQATVNLRAAGYGPARVRVVVGDGTLGAPEWAPYAAIIVAAAAPAVPPPLIEQLAEGGRLVQPIGPAGDDEVICFARQGGSLRRVRRLCHAYFVPLIGRHGLAR
ncbi:MAG: protein-L-isoaspartate(D-aspartate) O-methyltransferase [Chloroflexota bacterium]|nr:protein-L-isoaspartate(D-aspartate) O-methyltransferase [Chloroflexota bacterium]